MTIALIAASHGTCVPAAREAITALVDAVRVASPHLDVREAFVDVQQPRLDEVVDSVEGLSVVVPLLLTPGFHVRVDIARAVERPSAVSAPPLGPDSPLTGMLLDRLARAGATPDDVVVLGVAGSSDQRALRSINVVARHLEQVWGAPVPVGHVGGSGTPIGEVLRELSRSGRRIVVASYLMAPGFFFTKLQGCGADVVSRPLLDGQAVDPRLVSLVLDRFAEGAGRLDWSSAPPAPRRSLSAQM
jgi:sirohydrochlorin ferrochelatase